MAQAPTPQTPTVVVSGVDVGGVWYRQGPAFTDERRVEIVTIRGPVIVALLDPFDAGYPYRRGWNRVVVAATDRTELIVIRISRYDDTVDPPEKWVEYVIYIRGFGWWRFRGNDAIKLEGISEINKILEEAGRLEIYEEPGEVPPEPVYTE